MTTTTYRPDIDGMRGLAVLAVVAFHAFPTALPGGYVGVDVFFVISGFLITSIIRADIANGTFTFARFFGRRIRRIVPALAVVLAATLALAWYTLLPAELVALGHQIVAGSGFYANLLFLQESNYFDVDSTTKPLLHLWSLGIEEQFYLLWPCLLLLFARNRLGAAATAVVAGASLLLWIWLLRDANVGVAFYATFSRLWELLAGALLVGVALRPQTRHGVSAVGLALVAVAIASPPLRWGGVDTNVMLAVLGSAALICAGPTAAPNAHGLSCKPLVVLGLISYPLYLWHWPPLALRNLLAGPDAAPALGIAAIAISLGLAALTYRLVEIPIRTSRLTRRATGVCVAALVAAAGLGVWISAMDGLPQRAVALQNRADPASAVIGADRETSSRAGCVGLDPALYAFCSSSGPASIGLAVWGDSKGDALYWGVARRRRADASDGTALIGNTTCPPSAVPVGGDGKCDAGNANALRALLAAPEIRIVVLSFADRSLHRAKGPATEAGVAQAARMLLDGGKRVVMVLDTPPVTDVRGPAACGRTLRAPIVGELMHLRACGDAVDAVLARTAGYRAAVRRITDAAPGLQVVDPMVSLCPDGTCRVYEGNKYLYSYSDHLSDTGSDLVSAQLARVLESEPAAAKGVTTTQRAAEIAAR